MYIVHNGKLTTEWSGFTLLIPRAFHVAARISYWDHRPIEQK